MILPFATKHAHTHAHARSQTHCALFVMQSCEGDVAAVTTRSREVERTEHVLPQPNSTGSNGRHMTLPAAVLKIHIYKYATTNHLSLNDKHEMNRIQYTQSNKPIITNCKSANPNKLTCTV